ncbi:hypothetical protein A0J61_05485 [Choanephora cucurbitarum]|uniref:Uncharacterized protein n=1 Tax=Choanephora cucurbitarum TaxID=101091 RepID=A0A1C7ND27_9FUNG|nr:hypothetical protein A0J61_05485 [Choanephora cucurbitarum]
MNPLIPDLSAPLTEENLAIHTSNFPPQKDARRRNTRLFVESQIPIVAFEQALRQQEKSRKSLKRQDKVLTYESGSHKFTSRKRWQRCFSLLLGRFLK